MNNTWLLFFALCFAVQLSAQDTNKVIAEDTVKVKDKGEQRKSPMKATLLSAVLPGAGQAYNGKYWKMPIVYAGIGTSVFFILDNRRNYLEFKNAYLRDIDDNLSDSSEFALQGIQPQQLRTAADQYRQWMEWSYIAAGIIYVLQIVDASVDAHLYYFDVSDDLTLHWRPEVFATRNRTITSGITLSLSF